MKSNIIEMNMVIKLTKNKTKIAGHRNLSNATARNIKNKQNKTLTTWKKENNNVKHRYITII